MQTLSMCVLAVDFYSPSQIGAFIRNIGTMDDFLLDEGTYYVAERKGQIVGSGGWSLLQPSYAKAAASEVDGQIRSNQPKVRSVYVHPAFARRRLASRLMSLAEGEAMAAGFDAIELGATLSGVPLYAQLGYESTGSIALDLPGGLVFGGATMRKRLMNSGAADLAVGPGGYGLWSGSRDRRRWSR